MQVSYVERLVTELDRFSNWRMSIMSHLLKRIMPDGHWGSLGDNFETSPSFADREVFLTFDDGPSPETTPALLDLLAEHDVKASFFLIGRNAASHPDLVKRIAEAGHVIGNHSWGHGFMPSLSLKRQKEEIERTNEVIAETTGTAPTFFRPPYGMMDQRTASCLLEKDMRPVYWTSAPEDWQIPGAGAVVRRVLMDLKPGSLIVLHEGKFLARQTLTAAKELIYCCKNEELNLAKVNLHA